jgi:hypothetical protein
VQHIYVFMVAPQGNLLLNMWNGSTWQWVDQGIR